MPRNLEADLKLCEDAKRIGKFSSFGMSHTTVQLATGWAETIRELMEARKQIAELKAENSRYRNTMRNARRRIEELEDDE